jgi:cell wall assembly regulator SMI1
MLIKRSTPRCAASVTTSWQRIERWYQTHAPEVIETLRPGATQQQISSFETTSGVRLPDDVRQSFLIHDGQRDKPYPGAIVGAPYDQLDCIEGSIRFHRQMCEKYEASDADHEFDTRCTSYPLDAIQRRCFSTRLIAIGDWDGNCIGIDLDPGPNGVSGQVINFGRDLDEWRFVLALSWAHFLEDIADELEAGNLAITRDSESQVMSFGRTGHRDQSILNFCDEWSKAKLPAAFQEVQAVPGVPVFPGDVITGDVARAARARVDGFIRAMHQFETAWLQVRPIHKFGYSRLSDNGRLGFSCEPLGEGQPVREECDLHLENALVQDVMNGLREALQSGRGSEAARMMNEAVKPLADKLQIGMHIQNAVRDYRAILQKHCTNRQRANDGQFIQVYPSYYDPARDRVAEVRQVSPEKLVVYMEAINGKTTRYHLLQTGDHWLIDFKDETLDHVAFARKPLLFGAE